MQDLNPQARSRADDDSGPRTNIQEIRISLIYYYQQNLRDRNINKRWSFVVNLRVERKLEIEEDEGCYLLFH
ncbi:putative Ets domain-containing protein [Helianthus annuus]|nr:putative Ets domain-containing protein [Helianthus annuus]